MDFLASVSQPLRERLAVVGREQHLVAGQILIRRDAVDPRFYLLIRGQLAVESEGQSDTLGPGHIVGAIGFLNQGPTVSNVHVRSDSCVVAFDRSSLFEALSDQPLLMTELITRLVALSSAAPVESLVADERERTAHVDALLAQALLHRAVRHPYLQALSQGSLPDPEAALADFALHYHGYSSHFPRYLTATISRLENPAHRAALLQNLNEESGHYEPAELAELAEHGVRPEWIVGIAHPDLFRRFRRALGVQDLAGSSDHLEVVCWREMFLSILSGGTAAQAIGALGLGTESIVQAIYKPFVAAIQRLGSLSPEATVFFPLHTAVDDHHQATLRSIAVDFAATSQGREDLAKGMVKALALRVSFWDFLYERARSFPRRI